MTIMTVTEAATATVTVTAPPAIPPNPSPHRIPSRSSNISAPRTPGDGASAKVDLVTYTVTHALHSLNWFTKPCVVVAVAFSWSCSKISWAVLMEVFGDRGVGRFPQNI